MKLDPTNRVIHIDRSEIDVLDLTDGFVNPAPYVDAAVLADSAVMARARILTELEAMTPQIRLEREPEFRRAWMVLMLALEELSYVPTN